MSTTKPKAKLPVKQLAILAVCRIAEPITLTSVFPYLYFMIKSFGVQEEKIAVWAGILSASFSISQVFTAVAWGRLSDKLGRKPVILMGTLGTIISATVFGFSSNLTMAIIARCCLGALNGNVGIIRSVVAELIGDNKEHQRTAFALMPLVWAVGSIIGPMLGGALSQPSKKYPTLFPPGSLFDRYPFALPNVVAVACLLFGFIFAIFFLQETLETRKDARDPGLLLGKKITDFLSTVFARKTGENKTAGENETTPLLNGSSATRYIDSIKNDEENRLRKSKGPVKPHKSPSLREVLTRQSTYNILVYFQLALHSVAFDQLVPIFLSAAPADKERFPFYFPWRFSGGFGKSSSQVGSFFSTYGVVCMLLQVFLFPPITRRLGTLAVLRYSQMLYPFVYLLMPLTLFLPKGPAQNTGILVIMFAKGFSGIFSFPASTIMLTNSANGTRVLGTLNGFATCVAAAGRAMGPTFTGFMFSQGQKLHWGYPPWLALAIFSAVGGIPIRWLVEGNGLASKEQSPPDSDSEDEIENHRGEFNAAVEADTINPPLAREEARALEGEREDENNSDSPASKQQQQPFMHR